MRIARRSKSQLFVEKLFAVCRRLQELQISVFHYFYSPPALRLRTENSRVLCSGITLLKSVQMGPESSPAYLPACISLPFCDFFLSLECSVVVKYCLQAKIIPFQWDFIPALPTHITQPGTNCYRFITIRLM